MINVADTQLTNNRNNNTSSVLIVCNKYTSLKAGQSQLCHVSEDDGEEDFVTITVEKPKMNHGHRGCPIYPGWAHEDSVQSRQ